MHVSSSRDEQLQPLAKCHCCSTVLCYSVSRLGVRLVGAAIHLCRLAALGWSEILAGIPLADIQDATFFGDYGQHCCCNQHVFWWLRCWDCCWAPVCNYGHGERAFFAQLRAT